jgi:alpha-beta hydrolase superfamily lysophospholipase
MNANCFYRVLFQNFLAFLCFVVLMTLCGCASTHSFDKTLDKVELHDYMPSVPVMREASEVSQIKYIEVKNQNSIPVRYFKGEEGYCPVILFHGLQSHSLWFVQSARFIADLGIPVYAMDRRGSGLSRSKRGDAKNYQEMVDDIDAVVEYAIRMHNAKQVHILGHCFGAIPATLYASIHPEKVKSIILPTPGIHTHSDLSFGQKLNVFFSKLTWQNTYIPVPLKTELFTDLEAYRDFVEQDKLSLKYATASMYYTIHKARIYLRKNKGNITAPVFMAFAGRDQISDNNDNKEFFDHLSNPKNLLKTYNQARHILEYSADKDVFFADLKDWFREVGELK